MPFATPEIRADKFEKHRSEFARDEPAAANEVEYEQLADAFLLGPCPAHTLECRRARGHLLRYNTLTEEFGVLDRNRGVLAYYKPDPTIHRCANNLVYFQRECRK